MLRSRSMLKLCSIAAFAGLATAAMAGAVEDAAPGGQIVAGTWEHRHANFSYFGITSLYSCSGLETNIRALLQHLGARKDVKVSARGCPYGYDTPGRSALVEMDFYTLVPSTDTIAADAVQAHWTPVVVNSTKPNFMGRGNCELIEEMKDVISKNFSFRDLDYRTDCVPHEVNIDDFGIKAQALKPLPESARASRG
jgi:hypothetical protein